jgi:hypothetical protein
MVRGPGASGRRVMKKVAWVVVWCVCLLLAEPDPMRPWRRTARPSACFPRCIRGGRLRRSVRKCRRAVAWMRTGYRACGRGGRCRGGEPPPGRPRSGSPTPPLVPAPADAGAAAARVSLPRGAPSRGTGRAWEPKKDPCCHGRAIHLIGRESPAGATRTSRQRRSRDTRCGRPLRAPSAWPSLRRRSCRVRGYPPRPARSTARRPSPRPGVPFARGR